MQNTTLTSFERQAALIGGLLYFVIIFIGLTSELVLRGPLLIADDAVATAAAIGRAPWRLGLSVLGDAAMVVADVVLALMLYIVFRGVGAVLAGTAALLRLMQAAVIAGGLTSLWSAGHWAAIEDGVAMAHALLLEHGLGYDLGLIFFGVASLIMAVLVHRHAAFPDLLAWGLGAAGLVYLVGSITRVVTPDANAMMQPAYLIAVVAETAFATLLLRFGLKGRRAALPAEGAGVRS